jgi:hypothetical protein
MTHIQDEIILLTNERLGEANKKVMTTAGEVLKSVGVMIRSTKFEFKSPSSLWSTTPTSKFVAAPSFGATGMSQMQFEDL